MENNIFGFDRIKLSQSKFKNGNVYLSILLKNLEIEYLDIRFFIQKENYLSPTKQGFRIPSLNLEEFYTIIQQDPKEIGECEIYSTGSRSLRFSYSSDYGDGINFRYFKDDENYSGWEKRGIRVLIKDFDSLKAKLLSFRNKKFNTEGMKNYFEDFEIVTYAEIKENKTVPKKNEGAQLDNKLRPNINEDILRIIDGNY
jgi:hypothetical protein